jgi:hypothetical protein
VVALSAAAVVLAGVLVWVLVPEGGHSGVTGNAATPRVPARTPGTTTATPGAAGSPTAGAAPRSGTAGTTGTAGPSAPSAAPGDLLTTAGMRTTIAAMLPQLAKGQVRELVIYSQYATAEAPTLHDPKLYDDLVYRDGEVTRSPGSTRDPADDPVADVRLFDPAALPALLARAQRTLGVAHPTSRYVILGTDLFSGSPTIRVYLGDDYGSGFLEATPKGKVTDTFPRGG